MSLRSKVKPKWSSWWSLNRTCIWESGCQLRRSRQLCQRSKAQANINCPTICKAITHRLEDWKLEWITRSIRTRNLVMEFIPIETQVPIVKKHKNHILPPWNRLLKEKARIWPVLEIEFLRKIPIMRLLLCLILISNGEDPRLKQISLHRISLQTIFKTRLSQKLKHHILITLLKPRKSQSLLSLRKRINMSHQQSNLEAQYHLHHKENTRQIPIRSTITTSLMWRHTKWWRKTSNNTKAATARKY